MMTRTLSDREIDFMEKAFTGFFQDSNIGFLIPYHWYWVTRALAAENILMITREPAIANNQTFNVLFKEKLPDEVEQLRIFSLLRA